MSTSGLLGIGYEGMTLDGLISRLRLNRVDVLVDVRLNAISRKRGFSKTALRNALEAAGIDYVHLPQLGNPRDNRAGYSATTGEAADVARTNFRSALDNEPARTALAQISELSKKSRVAVFCFEAEQEHCHRQQVIEAVESSPVLV